MQYITVTSGGTIATTNTATLTGRVVPGLKDALCTAAQQQHRSISNRVEVLIRNYCGEHGIAIEAPAVGEIIKDQSA